ncbi:MAG: hypothetical protein QOG15_1858 [Solirubrobacteraceae bacterium]|jgi:Flp pilus assembly protein TadD|nr:hypothetical protein [Solirubrobacteraceae bacterium]
MVDRTRGRWPALAIAALAAALGIYLALSQGGEAKLKRAQDDVRVGRSAQALADLKGVDGQVSGRAAAVRGYAYLMSGRDELAARQLDRAARNAPNDWQLQRDYAVVLRTLGRRAEARARMRRAVALNPLMALPPGFRRARAPAASP